MILFSWSWSRWMIPFGTEWGHWARAEKCIKTLHQSRDGADEESEIHPYTELGRAAVPSYYVCHQNYAGVFIYIFHTDCWVSVSRGGYLSGYDFQHRVGDTGERLRRCKSEKSKFEAKANYYALCKHAMSLGANGKRLMKNTNAYKFEI